MSKEIQIIEFYLAQHFCSCIKGLIYPPADLHQFEVVTPALFLIPVRVATSNSRNS